MKTPKQVENFRESEPLKTVSINKHLQKQAINTQLTIEDRIMLNGHSAHYDFTILTHFEIVDMFESLRHKYNLNLHEFSKLHKYTKSCYNQKVNGQHRFSRSSFKRFKDVFIILQNIANDTQPTPTPVINNNYELTEDVCINFLKSTGKYKISKAETITNWTEL